LAVLAPAVAGFVLGLFFLPQLRAPFIGAGIGWIAAALFLTRSKIPMQYRDAVRHLRKNEYAEAVKVMDGVIKAEPDQPNHYRFRAEILRLWGKLDRARSDYQKMIEIDQNSAIAYNGLAEVLLQAEDFAAAREAALKAYQLAPDDWVTSYNLGMIEDRLRQSEYVIDHLQAALDLKVSDARHRLLIHLYLARAYQRLGNADAAQNQIRNLKQHRDGLDEWKTIMVSDQAGTLRAVLAEDINSAQKLLDGELDVAAWSSG
jgi:tetratricopeptide (TPR) repeat protein